MTTSLSSVKGQMSEPVRVYIERMKAALGAVTDEDLSKSLGISKQAIANWRRREKIPLDIELKMVERFGPDLAHEPLTREFALSRENQIVHATALYIFSYFEKRIGRETSIEEKLALGGIFREVEEQLRSEVRGWGIDEMRPEPFLKTMILHFNRGYFKEIDALFSKALILSDKAIRD